MPDKQQAIIPAGSMFVTMLYDMNDGAYRALADIDLQAVARDFRAEYPEGEWLDRDAFKAMLVRKGLVELVECLEVSIPEKWDRVESLEAFRIGDD